MYHGGSLVTGGHLLIIVFDYLTDASTLEELINVAGLPNGPRFQGVWVTDKQTLVGLPDNATTDEKGIVNLAAAKGDVLWRCHLDCQNFIYSHYPQDRQTSFALLLIQGIAQFFVTGAPYINRIAYIMSGFAWAQLSINAYYVVQDAALNCTTLDDLSKLTWDFTMNASVDPYITLRAAGAINN